MWKYLICLVDEVRGTDDIEQAKEYAKDDDNFVIETSSCCLMNEDGSIEHEPIQAAEIVEVTDDSEEDEEEEGDDNG